MIDAQKKIEINDSLLSYKNGNREAVNKLYYLISPTLGFIALKYLKNKEDAKDLMQDFWADIDNIADKFSYFKNGFSYLAKIMTNMAINRYHQIYGEKVHVVEYVDYEQIQAFDDNTIPNLEIRIAVQEAFKRLSLDERIIMQLRIFEDKSIVQIAKELKMSKSDVGRKKQQAEKKLKRELFKNNWEKR